MSPPPDVCNTPTPSGPTPTPYVNVGKSSELAKGTKRVKISGNSVAIMGAELRTSTGDEPGSGGGLTSGGTKGKIGWISGSPNVRFEGKPVVRFMDTCLQNGNTYNTAFKLMGGTGWAYGDDAPCFLCDKPREPHRFLESNEVAAKSRSFHKSLFKIFAEQRPLISRSLRIAEDIKRARKARDGDVAPLLALKNSAKAALEAELRLIHEQLAPIHVLRPMKHRGVKTPLYTAGFMLAVLRCRCGEEYVASSSASTPGLRKAIADSGANAALADPVNPAALSSPTGPLSTDKQARVNARLEAVLGTTNFDSWVCAAPKAIQACNAAGHRPNTLSERWFSPMGQTITVNDIDIDGELTQVIKSSGETTPSCRKCQILLPAMLCEAKDGPCA